MRKWWTRDMLETWAACETPPECIELPFALAVARHRAVVRGRRQKVRYLGRSFLRSDRPLQKFQVADAEEVGEPCS